jgi:2-polyprenyl-3-methyl-5-hydroxy-6-metoxy-1,4-benzoquinol methylase
VAKKLFNGGASHSGARSAGTKDQAIHGPQFDAKDVASPLTAGKSVLVATLDAQTVIDRYADIELDVRKTLGSFSQLHIFRCCDTGYRFFHPRSLAGEADFYEQLNQMSARDVGDEHDYREWSEDFQYAFDRIVPGEKLLDVGCGNGAFLRRAAEKADVVGIDGSRFAQRHCQRLGLDVHLGMISDYKDQFANRFDTVCAFQLLEHIYDVRAFLADLVEVVRPGGRVILAVPNNEPFLRRFDPYSPLNCPPHHVGLWDRESLEKAAPLFGLVPQAHHYCEVSGRWAVEAYLHARYLLGIKDEIHAHSLSQKLMMLALAPYTVPVSLLRAWRTKGRGTRNVIVMTFEKTPIAGRTGPA